MDRVNVAELLEDPSLTEEVAAKAYRDLARTQKFLGNTGAIFRRLGKNPGRVLDIGCGQGALLEEIQRRFGVSVIGVDLRPVEASAVPILTGNAAFDPLPQADVAISVCLVHHLCDADVVNMIRNVSKSCPRLILLDLVRHWMPLALFRAFVRPFLHRINAADGQTSIRRAYTPQELRALVDEALRGSSARVTHTVGLFRTRQIIEIEWPRPNT